MLVDACMHAGRCAGAFIMSSWTKPLTHTHTHTTQYVLAMFLAYPLAGVMSLLPSTKAKHAFSLLVGLWCVGVSL